MNIRAGIGLVLVGLPLAAVAVETSPASFDRYEIILARKPFGDLPPPVTEPAKPGPPLDSIFKYVKMCSIVKDDDGVLNVGLVDTRTSKANVLHPGESTPDGMIQLLDADFEKESAMLKSGDETVTLNIHVAQAMTSPGGAPPAVAAPGSPFPAPPVPGMMSYAERRRMRMEEANRPADSQPPQPKYTGEALEKHLHEYNMELIRTGGPPLPVQLTPEEDQQLQREGVLPPAP